MKRHGFPTAVSSSRSGFSLVELLIVIVILGILMSLIIPAITRARTRAQEAAVAAEISQLDQAVTRFKTRFGAEPPSSLTIPTSATGWAAEDRQKVLRIWDQFDFATLGGLGAYPSAAINLNGAECLVFFLGGGQRGLGYGTSDGWVFQEPSNTVECNGREPRCSVLRSVYT